MQRIGTPRDETWIPPICRTEAVRGEGVPDLADTLDRHARWLKDSGMREHRRRERARLQVRELALDALRVRFAAVGDGELLTELSRRVAARELDPYAASDRLIEATRAGHLSE